MQPDKASAATATIKGRRNARTTNTEHIPRRDSFGFGLLWLKFRCRRSGNADGKPNSDSFGSRLLAVFICTYLKRAARAQAATPLPSRRMKVIVFGVLRVRE
jgi:hypothetical protein